MNCIIIEDDKLSSRIIEEFIKKTAELKHLQTFYNAVDAINGLKDEDDVHLIFLDVELPDMTGIEFMDSLELTPQVIIISSKEACNICYFFIKGKMRVLGTAIN